MNYMQKVAIISKINEDGEYLEVLNLQDKKITYYTNVPSEMTLVEKSFAPS